MSGPNLTRRSLLVGATRFGAGIGSAGAAGGLSASFLAGCSDDAEAARLSFLNWQDYIAADTLSTFTTQSGVDVTYQTYASNDALYKLLQQANRTRRGGRRGTSFDLCVPTGDGLDRLRRAKLVQALGTVAGSSNISESLRGLPFDPNGTYGIPWASGTTGIAYDSDKLTNVPTWKELFSGDLGASTILDDSRDALAVAAMSLGLDPNKATCFKPASAVVANTDRDSQTYLERLVTGELVAAQAYSTDFVQAARRRPSLRYVVPPEGGVAWVDVLVIPAGAPRPGRSREFIEYILNPTTSQNLANAIGAQTAMASPKATGSDGKLFSLVNEGKARCVVMQPLSEVDQDLLDAAWQSVTATS
jgi:spermidine/putrescine-binding protein